MATFSQIRQVIWLEWGMQIKFTNNLVWQSFLVYGIYWLILKQHRPRPSFIYRMSYLGYLGYLYLSDQRYISYVRAHLSRRGMAFLVRWTENRIYQVALASQRPSLQEL